MLKYGFIGLGQVGGSFVDLAKKYNYPCLAINTARVDLAVLKNLGQGEKMHLTGYEGAGKDRRIGKESFEETKAAIIERITEKLSGVHVIFPVFALGGGTGSGMAPDMIAMLSELFPDKVVSPICFMPDRSESARAKINALDAFSEISTQNDVGAMFVMDLKKMYDQRMGVSLTQKYEQAKGQLLSLLHLFNEQTIAESPLANLDDMDLLTAFSARGAAVISQVPLDEDHIEAANLMGERIVKSWALSSLADVDPGVIGKLVMVAQLPLAMTSSFRLEEAFDKIGKPLEIFTGIYENEEPCLYTFASGMMYPGDILKELEEAVVQEEKRLVENLERTTSQTFSANQSWSVALSSKKRVRL
jgi:cell division GTPase FtsZ